MDEDAAVPDAGFDKMRAMLGRASEVRANEQRQVVEMLDDVNARLSPVEDFVADNQHRLAFTYETVTSILKRVGTLPDSTEVRLISERVEETLSRIDAKDETLQQLSTVLSALSERIGAPLDALEARLEGVAGRFEGVAGRLDGLDGRLQHLHARLDEIDGAVARAQSGLDALPDALDLPAVHGRFDELASTVHRRFDQDLGRVDGNLQNLLARPVLDPTERLETISARVEQLGERVEQVSGRVRSVDETVRNNAGTLTGSLEQGIDKLHGAVENRPDRDELARTLHTSQQESERRMTAQLDSVLADFAEVVIAQRVGAKTAARQPVRKAGKKPSEFEASAESAASD